MEGEDEAVRWLRRVACLSPAEAPSLRCGGSEECVERCDAATLTRAQFWRRFLVPNRPVLLTGVTTSWHCANEWVCADGSPDLAALAARFGSVAVQVTDCAETSAPRMSWSLEQFCEYLTQHQAGADSRLLYMTDVHLAALEPTLYSVPALFRDDWLNAFYDERCAGATTECRDYRFVYLGPPGTHTPLHADVLRSLSWSVNLTGTKRWLLFPPDQSPLLRGRGGALPENLAAELAQPSGAFLELPLARHLRELLQGPGEALFVPSGWHHTVENTGTVPVLSVNHNWFNAASVDVTWRYLQQDAESAAACIDDLRCSLSSAEFEALVQRNLRANAGLDYAQFATLLYGAVRDSRHALLHAGEGDSLETVLSAMACRRAGAILREMGEQPSMLAASTEEGEEPLQCAEWANELSALLVSAGFPALP